MTTDNIAPDIRRAKEKRAYYLWNEAMESMEGIMESKGIIAKQNWVNKYKAALA